METPKKEKKASDKQMEYDMEISCSENDFLFLNEIKIENDAIDCLDESPYLKSIKPESSNAVFKLSRKRLQCEVDSPNNKPQLSTNLFKSKFTSSTTQVSKKWRSASYNSVSKISPIKVDLLSPLKPIDGNIISSYINNLTDDSSNNNIKNVVTNIVSTQISNIPCNNISNIVPSYNLVSSNLNGTINHSHFSDLIQKPDQQLSTNLLGDYSNIYALPLISGRHKDLKTITPETMANLMGGNFSKSINTFTIVDARYPYEYEGGHINGAINIYHREEINKYFFGVEKPTLTTDKKLILCTILKNIKQSSGRTSLNRNHCLSVIKEDIDSTNTFLNQQNFTTTNNEMSKSKIRHAIIFHCEYSSERAPSLCRYLRKIDRELNEHCYPNLYYPEIYLLHGGYKLFFEKFKNLCYPPTYLPMHSSDHKQDLVKFRVKSKSWNCERKWKVLDQS